jgi:protein phosphatase
MIIASFGLSETGSVRTQNEDSYLLDAEHGLLAVADGLGGLPNGAHASRMALDILRQKLIRQPDRALIEVVTEVNEETRQIGYEMDVSGFGTTLTLARFFPGKGTVEIAHVGDSAAYLVRDEEAHLLTVEHTVAARMVAAQFEEAAEAIPASAHHTLTQCIGQELYIDPQIIEIPIQKGDRIFLFTDGVTKPVSEAQLEEALVIKDSLERVCQALTFRIEIAGSPDNYTIASVEV